MRNLNSTCFFINLFQNIDRLLEKYYVFISRPRLFVLMRASYLAWHWILSFEYKEVRTFSRWLSIRGTKFFWRDIQIIFFQKVHCGPIRWVPKRFFKILIFFSRNLHFNLGFWVISKIIACACWAYAETILSHTEHTRNEFSHAQPAVKVFTYKSMLSIRGTNFIAGWAYAEMFKSRISRPNRIRFSKTSCYMPLGP